MAAGKRRGAKVGKAVPYRTAAKRAAKKPKYAVTVGKPRGTGVTVGKPKIHKKSGAAKRAAMAKKTMPRRKVRGKKG